MSQIKSKAAAAALWVYIAIIIIWVILPVVYVFTGAFRGHNPTTWWENFWPVDFTTLNFRLAFQRSPLALQFWNSVVVTIFQAGLMVIFSILAAAAIVFGRLRHPGWIFTYMFITMMLPGESLIISRFSLMSKLGLYDTIPAIFLPFLTSAFSIFLLRQRFLSFPTELYEASLLDGVKSLRFVTTILIPLCKPTIFMVAINGALGAWNGYLWPLLITQTPGKRTLQVGISKLSDAESVNYGIILAGVVIVSIPMILFVMFGNKYLTRGLLEGMNK